MQKDDYLVRGYKISFDFSSLLDPRRIGTLYQCGNVPAMHCKIVDQACTLCSFHFSLSISLILALSFCCHVFNIGNV